MTTNSVKLRVQVDQLLRSAGLSWSEAAAKLGVSESELSNLEVGGAPISKQLLERLLREVIGTPQALQLATKNALDWIHLRQPRLDDARYKLFRRAERAAGKLKRAIQEHGEQPRTQEYLDALKRTGDALSEPTWRIALIGTVGVGKTTTLCRLEDLFVPDGDRQEAVLETGIGRTTVCEVRLEQGPTYGLQVEPCSPEMVRSYVEELVEKTRRAQGGASPGAPQESVQLHKEVERALRNLSGLRKPQEPAVDPVVELLRQHPEPKGAVRAILAKMRLADRKKVAFDCDGSGEQPLQWLKEQFKRVNRGIDPEVGLPNRIIVTLPRPVLGQADLRLELLDTKGVDETAARPDLECHWDQPNTLLVLCSSFNDAPAAMLLQFLKRAQEAGVRRVAERAALVVLYKENAARDMKDDVGERVASAKEGEELKGEEVKGKLSEEQLGDLPIYFFGEGDDPALLRGFFVDRIRAIQDRLVKELRELIRDSKEYLEKLKVQPPNEVALAMGPLKTRLEDCEKVLLTDRGFHQSLLDEIKKAHPSTLRASVARSGEWRNLNFRSELGHGAKEMVQRWLGSEVIGVVEVCSSLRKAPGYLAAQPITKQVERKLREDYGRLLLDQGEWCSKEIGELLRDDLEFWRDCRDSAGPGFRARVLERCQEWFKRSDVLTRTMKRRQHIHQEWLKVVRGVKELVERSAAAAHR